MELLFIVIKIVGIVFAVYYARRRVRAWRRKTEELGFQFTDKADEAFVRELSAFRMFKNAKPGNVTNLMRAAAKELRLGIFDYMNPSSGVKTTIIYFRAPALSLPRFTLRPESIWHRLIGLFGYQDIDFDTHSRFSRRYLLRGDNEEAIRGVFFQDVLDYFEENAGLQVSGIGDKLVVFQSAKQDEPDKLRPFLQKGFQVYDLFKAMSDGEAQEDWTGVMAELAVSR